MAFSIGGAGNIDTAAIIANLSQAYQRPILQLQQQAAQRSTILTAWGNLKSSLDDFRSALGRIGQLNEVNNRAVSVGDDKILSASVSRDTAAGSYQVQVTQLAQAHSVYSQTYADADKTVVGTGTLTLQLGSGAAVAVNIDSSNNTLNGIAAAINASSSGIRAGVVNDGTGYRLTLSGSKSGAANTVSVTASGTLTALNYDATTKTMTQSQAAQDALATINGLAVSSDTNRLDKALAGVSLDLKQVGSSSLTVSADNSAVKTALEGFIKDFNSNIKTMNDLSKYNAETREAGPLLGDPSLMSIRSRLLGMISQTQPGLPSDAAFRSLAEVGVGMNDDGTLKLDAAALSKAMDKDTQGIVALLSQTGQSSNSNVKFLSAGANTLAGTYAVDISQQASQATLASSVAVQPAGLALAEKLDFTYKTKALSVTLASGSTLAQMISTLNTEFDKAGWSGLRAEDQGGKLAFRTVDYGSLETFSVLSDQGAVDGTQTGFATTKTSTSGLDVMGTLGGQAATGVGRTLTGAGGGVTGLKVEIGGTAIGSMGTIAVSSGLYSGLTAYLGQVLDGQYSVVKGATDSLNKTLDGIQTQINRLQESADRQTSILQQQFDAMQATLSQIQQSGDLLSGFFESMQAASKK